MAAIKNDIISEQIKEGNFIKTLQDGGKEYSIKDQIVTNRVDILEEKIERIDAALQVLNNTVSKLLEAKIKNKV